MAPLLAIGAITGLALVYGLAVKVGGIPCSAEIGFSDRQWAFLRRWVKLAVLVGILLPAGLWANTGGQPTAPAVWGPYFGAVALQLVTEGVFSRWLVPSVVVPIGLGYTALRLWQLGESGPRLALSPPAVVGFWGVVLFWVANLVMLTAIAIPAIYRGRSAPPSSRVSPHDPPG